MTKPVPIKKPWTPKKLRAMGIFTAWLMPKYKVLPK